MANALSRALVATLAVIVALSLGCASTHPAGLGVKKVGIHAVVVGPKADQITIDELHLSKSKYEVAFWAAREKGKKLYIEFPVEVFEGMTPNPRTGRFQIQCTGRHCYSDEIKVPYHEGDERLNTYKYWQTLDDGSTPDTADGIIVIDP